MLLLARLGAFADQAVHTITGAPRLAEFAPVAFTAANAYRGAAGGVLEQALVLQQEHPP